MLLKNVDQSDKDIFEGVEAVICGPPYSDLLTANLRCSQPTWLDLQNMSYSVELLSNRWGESVWAPFLLCNAVQDMIWPICGWGQGCCKRQDDVERRGFRMVEQLFQSVGRNISPCTDSMDVATWPTREAFGAHACSKACHLHWAWWPTRWWDFWSSRPYMGVWYLVKAHPEFTNGVRNAQRISDCKMLYRKNISKSGRKQMLRLETSVAFKKYRVWKFSEPGDLRFPLFPWLIL